MAGLEDKLDGVAVCSDHQLYVPAAPTQSLVCQHCLHRLEQLPQLGQQPVEHWLENVGDWGEGIQTRRFGVELVHDAV